MRSATLGVVALVSLLPAQSVRDEWQHLARASDFASRMDRTLADAPITPDERAAVYAFVDNKSVHDSYPGDRREQERRVVLSAPVGLIALARNGGRQIVVRSPDEFCGGTGNCEFWLFVRGSVRPRLILDTAGKGLLDRGTSHLGFADLVVPFHDSAFETSYTIYRWNGTGYGQIDCYLVTHDREYPERSPRITTCPAPSH